MKNSLLGAALILSISAVLAYAGEDCEIKLNDGTKISGEVMTLHAGIYRIKTESMDIVDIEQSKVVSIIRKLSNRSISPAENNADAKEPGASPKMVEGGINTIKQSMEGNPRVMDSISSLRNDPDFQAVLNDPEIMAAVNSYDIGALQNNPKFLRLLENSKVREIGDDLQQ